MPQEEKIVKKTNDDWKKELTEEQYQVTREKGTERAFTGEYWDCHEDGVYHCRCCKAPLFNSNTKFDSGSGWPSFTQPEIKENITEQADDSAGSERTEVICSNCDAHLGHVFADGPAPTGQRYCINSVSIKLKTDDNNS